MDRFIRRTRGSGGFLAAFLALVAAAPRALAGPPADRPDIVVCIADDASWADFGAYGYPIARTPNFDRVAREGALFTHAFTSSPSCTPSRGALLTGQDFWRLGAAGNLWSRWPGVEAVYPDLLAERAGYELALMGKGWSPGEIGDRKTNPAGPLVKDFDALAAKLAASPDEPFHVWYGSVNPHRPYRAGAGAEAGFDPAGVRVPASLPDTPEVRGDLLDYAEEIARFDAELGEVMRVLEEAGRLDRTLLIVTSDNGFPFPRGKTNLYDRGARMPLAVRWPGRVPPGTVVERLVCHTDWAPTFLRAARLEPTERMTGRDLLPLLEGRASGGAADGPDRVFFGRERHADVREGDLGYPSRAIRTREHLYIRNFEPDRWPAGDPPIYGDVDPADAIEGSPTKKAMLAEPPPEASEAQRRDHERRRALAFGKRPGEELYDLASDPEGMRNLLSPEGADAGGGEILAEVEAIRASLRAQLDARLLETGDPRMTGDGESFFDRYPRVRGGKRRK